MAHSMGVHEIYTTLHARSDPLDAPVWFMVEWAIRIVFGVFMSTTSPSFDAEEFKRQVEHHIETGWVDLPLDQKLFICRYIKDGHSIVPMTTCPDNRVSSEEAQSYIRNPMIQAAIADVSKKYAEVTAFTKTGLQARLARALDMAMGECPVPAYDKAGDLNMVRRVDHAAIARYLEMATKIAEMDDDEKVDNAAPWAMGDDE